MATVEFEPLTVAVRLWEEPPGVFRVGDSRVLLELVLRAFKRGESPEAIVRSYRTLRLADVYAVISRYLANPASYDGDFVAVIQRGDGWWMDLSDHNQLGNAASRASPELSGIPLPTRSIREGVRCMRWEREVR